MSRSRPRRPSTAPSLDARARSPFRPVRLAARSRWVAVQFGFASTTKVARSSCQARTRRSIPSGNLRSLRRLRRGSSPRAAKRASASSYWASSKLSTACRTFFSLAEISWRDAFSMRTVWMARRRISAEPAGDPGRMSASYASTRPSTSSRSPSGTTIPSPLNPCLSEFLRETDFPNSLAGPFPLEPLVWLARIRASETIMAVVPFAIGVGWADVVLVNMFFNFEQAQTHDPGGEAKRRLRLPVIQAFDTVISHRIDPFPRWP